MSMEGDGRHPNVLMKLANIVVRPLLLSKGVVSGGALITEKYKYCVHFQKG